jgi:hypothetical protein
VTGDNGKIVTLSNAASITVTAPASLGAGFNCILIQLGAGQVTVAPGSGATVTNRQSLLKLAGSGAVGTLIASAASTYDVAGEERA